MRIDGSFGEGGGQIIRSAIVLSCITKTPIQIDNIRKGRTVPGLRAQHLTSIKLLAKICNAQVEDLTIGSKSIKFIPNDVKSYCLKENIGTAGSISLLLQVLIPSVSISKKSLNLSIIGGTDVAWSPTSYYTKYVLMEAYSRFGINFSMEIKKRGYFPKGGGIVELQVFPSNKIIPIHLHKRKTNDVRLLCSFSKIDKEKITDKMMNIKNILEKKGFTVSSEIQEEIVIGAGSSLLIFSVDSDSIIGSDGLLESKTGDFPDKIVDDFVSSNLGVDNHLADMLVLPASLTNGTTVFRVRKITKHLETNLYITSKMTGCKYDIKKLNIGFEVTITGSLNPNV